VPRIDGHALFWAVVLVLLVLHMDPFAGDGIEPVAFGWIPRDLGYHLVWIAVATLTMFWMCARVWRDDE
jgi:hypothetical protein